jgi:hypothetical protein
MANPMAKLKMLKALLAKGKGPIAGPAGPGAATPPAMPGGPGAAEPGMAAPPASSAQRRMGQAAEEAAEGSQNVQLAPNKPGRR